MTDSFENRLVYFIDQYKRLTWNQINDLLEKEMGFRPNPNYLHYSLKKLRNEERIKFVSIGDFTSYLSLR
jgi:hypothetical protein